MKPVRSFPFMKLAKQGVAFVGKVAQEYVKIELSQIIYAVEATQSTELFGHDQKMKLFLKVKVRRRHFEREGRHCMGLTKKE
jgi:hypothetical protein